MGNALDNQGGCELKRSVAKIRNLPGPEPLVKGEGTGRGVERVVGREKRGREGAKGREDSKEARGGNGDGEDGKENAE